MGLGLDVEGTRAWDTIITEIDEGEKGANANGRENQEAEKRQGKCGNNDSRHTGEGVVECWTGVVSVVGNVTCKVAVSADGGDEEKCGDAKRLGPDELAYIPRGLTLR